LARALSGDLVRAQELLAANVQYAQTRRDGVHREGPRRYTHDEAAALLHDHRFTVERIESARLFADLVSSALVDSDPAARRALVELEHSVASRPEFLPIASQLHLLARR